MRTIFEEEEEIAPSNPRQSRGQIYGEDRELTISSTTLLAIFFGLVLICGLFFGLGYTLGRRAPSEASPLPSASTATSDLQPTASAAKPSASSQPVEAAPPVADPQATDTSAGATTSTEPQEDSPQARTPETTTIPAQQTVKPALPPPAPSVTPAPTAVTALNSAATPSGIMVQIAAISNPADADVLVSALQKRGYTVTARRFSGDPLIHVQVGPFSNRADAIAMRQKLLSDGYNAILK
jgi:DedD protein